MVKKCLVGRWYPNWNLRINEKVGRKRHFRQRKKQAQNKDAGMRLGYLRIVKGPGELMIVGRSHRK